MRRLAYVWAAIFAALPVGVPQPLILTLAFTVVIVSLGAVTLGTLRPRS